jgi:seryl-tRNA synthetase
MKNVSNKSKILYLVILVVFISTIGLFWLDYIGLININRSLKSHFKSEPSSVVDAMDDTPSLIEKEEFEKEKQKLLERIEDLDRRDAEITKQEESLEKDKEELKEMRKGVELEKKKLEDTQKQYSGYKKNVKDLALKIISIKPQESVQIMIQWEDTLIIDVLRQIDVDAAETGKISISSYLISLMPSDRASRIMYLMTQL